MACLLGECLYFHYSGRSTICHLQVGYPRPLPLIQVSSPGLSLATWARGAERLGECHLSRDIKSVITAAGQGVMAGLGAMQYIVVVCHKQRDKRGGRETEREVTIARE